ncbi:MAG: superoxide dismutase [Alphaproteobacteria bacterium]|nr:superoxide dismutase [Alphaproteobacteria bacterium]
MIYAIKPLPFEPEAVTLLSEKLVQSHHANNYSGAVKRLNALRAEFARLDWTKAANFTLNGLKREELIAANSAFLHELYFESIGAGSALKPGGLAVAFARDFGAFERWRDEFTAMGKALGGGSGWVLCSWSSQENRLVNQWAADHAHLLGGATPILALDMYEHAYHMDFGANAALYVDTFMANIDWEKANARYGAAIHHATSDLAMPSAEVLGDRDKIMLVDVRRQGTFAAAKEMIAGATWQDPEKVETWSSTLPPAKPVVVYCVYGHEVGQSTAAILRAKGIDARFLAGGIHDWLAAGRPIQKK